MRRKIVLLMILNLFIFLIIIANDNKVYAVRSDISVIASGEEGGLMESSPIVGHRYSNYLSNKPINPAFGDAIIYENGIGSETEKIVREGWWAWDKTKESFADKVYVVYKFPKRLNLRIEKLSDLYYFVSSGITKSSTYYREKGYSYVYEVSVGTELSTKSSTNEELSVDGIEYYGASLGGKITYYSEIEGKLSRTVTKTTSYTYSQSISETFEINASTSSYYSYEKRGAFDLFVCQVYEVIYSETKTKREQLYQEYDYTYTAIGYKLLEQNVKLTYVNDTLEEGYYMYNKDQNGNFCYSDYKINNMVYY